MTGLRLNLGLMRQQTSPRIASCLRSMTWSVFRLCPGVNTEGLCHDPGVPCLVLLLHDVVHILQKDAGLHRGSGRASVCHGHCCPSCLLEVSWVDIQPPRALSQMLVKALPGPSDPTLLRVPSRHLGKALG